MAYTLWVRKQTEEKSMAERKHPNYHSYQAGCRENYVDGIEEEGRREAGVRFIPKLVMTWRNLEQK